MYRLMCMCVLKSIKLKVKVIIKTSIPDKFYKVITQTGHSSKS